MKVLFLDIDGVCNSAAYAKARYEKTGRGGLLGIDPVPAKRVRRIVEQTGCKIVLSSTWRLYERSREQVRSEVCNFIDITPRNLKGVRGDEIKQWLDAHPEVAHYAILDDDSDMLPGQPLFKTRFKYGLTEKITEMVIKHLNG